MRANWLETPKDGIQTNYADRYSVTMNPQGFIMLSRRTWQNMGEPVAFQILFDHINSRIGLKPTTINGRNAYRVLKWGRSGGKKLHALRTIKEFSIVVPETLRFTRPEPDEDGILVLDIRTARPCPHSIGALTWRRLKREADQNLATNGHE